MSGTSITEMKIHCWNVRDSDSIFIMIGQVSEGSDMYIFGHEHYGPELVEDKRESSFPQTGHSLSI